MARFVQNQNALVGLYESGTYGSTSGNFWIGLVQNHNIAPSEGTFAYRYLTGQGRGIDRFDQGPIMFKGEVSYFPQDFRMLQFAMGSCTDAGSPSPYTHTIGTLPGNNLNQFTSGPLSPFTSFALEESTTAPGTGQNWVRTVKGCMVDEFTLEGKQGEILNASISWLGQSGAWQSGTPTQVTAFTYGTGTVGSIVDRPYIFNDVNIAIPSGTNYESLTEFKFSYKNNLEERYYLTGSSQNRNPAAPIANETTIMLDLSFDAMSERAKTLYENYYVGGSEFNAILSVNASTGSRDNTIVLSGCRIMDSFDSPMGLTGPFPNKISVQAKVATSLANDLVQKYNPW